MPESAVDRCLRQASAYHHRAWSGRWSFDHAQDKSIGSAIRNRSTRAANVQRKSTPLPASAVSGPAGAFAQLVAENLEGPFLRYSARMTLLKEAQRRGIDRFEANLIIAAVQHKAKVRDESRVQRGVRGSEFGVQAKPPSRLSRVVEYGLGVLAFLAIEALIVGGIWLWLA